MQEMQPNQQKIEKKPWKLRLKRKKADLFSGVKAGVRGKEGKDSTSRLKSGEEAGKGMRVRGGLAC